MGGHKSHEFNIDISRKVFNDSFFPFLKDDTPVQIFFGGSSAGKSQFAVGQRVVFDLLSGDRNYLILRNTARTSRKSTFNQVCQTISLWGVSHLFKITNTEMVITCANGYQALFEGLDDVEKLKSILPQKGVITDIIIEEATETKRDDIKQLRRRLRGQSRKPKRFTMLFNPIIRTHWIYEDFFKGRFMDGDKCLRDPDLLIFHSTYKDNKFLAPEDVAVLENEDDQYFYDVYTLGKWGVLGGVIFSNWRVADLSGVVHTFDNIKNGLDFGFSNDPATWNRIHYDKKRKKIYIFDEMHELGMTNPGIYDYLSPIIKDELVVCDSSEPKSIQELKELGLNAVGAKKGPDSVRFGIQFLQQHEIIVDRHCQETINELELYQWKKLRTGEATNIPVDKNNHHIDDIRYSLEDEMLELKTTPRIAVVGERVENERVKEKPETRPGETVVPIYEGDQIVGWEKIGTGRKRRGGVLG